MTPVVSTETLVARLTHFQAALDALATMKSVTIDGTSYTRSDEPWIEKMVAKLEDRIGVRQGQQRSVSIVVLPR